jgi:rRNA maturation endonuclease Nob1
MRHKEQKRYKAWCWGCDRALVDAGKKCPICFARMRIKGK